MDLPEMPSTSAMTPGGSGPPAAPVTATASRCCCISADVSSNGVPQLLPQ